MFSKMTIGLKIKAGFGLAVLLAVAAGGVGWYGTRQIQGHTSAIATEGFPRYEALAALNLAQMKAMRFLNRLSIRRYNNPAVRDVAHAGFDETLRLIDQQRAQYAALPKDGESERIWREVQPQLDQWISVAKATHELLRERTRLLAANASEQQLDQNDDRAWPLWSEAQDKVKPVDSALNALATIATKELAARTAEADLVARSAQITLFIALGLGTALLAALAGLIARSIGRALSSLRTESERLSSAVEKGAVATRADADAVPAEFRPIIAGMNGTMDAFARPIRMASENMDRISRGDIPAQIEETYEGDFDRIKQSVNRCIGAVAAVVEDGKALASAAMEGNLSTRADAGKHQGDFRKIVEGFNGTLDAVMKPIEEATQVLQHLSQRDLRARVRGSYRGDHAKIAESLNATAGSLHDALAQVAQAVDQVSSASAQIASSSQAVASGASEQASSLEETGSSLESISSMTKHAADNAQQASALAVAAKVAATEGSAAMEQMTGAMSSIRTAAEGTSQIIKDINEIAFQTNLLALNAAVEAARAGEAGRGFAVVAEEVRSLALRSKEAANKTEDLIRQSVKEAGEGAITAQRVNEKLSEIVGSVSKVNDIVAEISAAGKEQAAGIEQVNRAMIQMNTVTQQNAASSEESSSAASELSSQSEELATMVGSFQLERGGEARPPATGLRPVASRKRAPSLSAPRANGHASGHGGNPLAPEHVIPFQDF